MKQVKNRAYMCAVKCAMALDNHLFVLSVISHHFGYSPLPGSSTQLLAKAEARSFKTKIPFSKFLSIDYEYGAA